MKKVLALILAISMMFVLAACGEEPVSDDPIVEEPIVENNPAVEAYFAGERGEQFLQTMTEQLMSSSNGWTCQSDLQVVGDGVELIFCIDGLNDVEEEYKVQMQTAYDALQPGIQAQYEAMHAEVEELKSFGIYVCEEDGDVLASIIGAE